MSDSIQSKGLTKLNPLKILHILITFAIMICFKFIPAAEPLTPLGMEVIGIFLGMLYGWLVANDSFWPSIMGLIFLGLSSYSTVPKVFTSGFGNNTVLLIFFFYAFTNVINAAGITDYIARWMVSRKFVQGKPYRLTLMIILAMCVLVIMVSATAATMVIFPIVKQISKVYDMEPGEKWPAVTLVSTVFVGCTAYMLLPFKSLPAVIFSNYAEISGTEISIAPYIAIVVAMTATTIALVLLYIKFIVKPDVSKIADSSKVLEQLPKLTGYQKFILGFFVVIVLLMLVPSFVPTTFIVSKVLSNMGATGILAAGIAVYLLLQLKQGVGPVQLFSKDMGWPIIFILAAALSIAGAITSEATGVTPWLVGVITPIVQGKSPIIFTAIICIIACVITNLANNVATAAMLTPIIYTIGIACGANTQALVICMMFATNIGLV
ncbi:MAG: SLC13 family permease, partial [Clostridia bacterium]|nr:SLC13 family permease [Clostridia bacterium]